jgi:outer membrane receptor protein involved in Fe transport
MRHKMARAVAAALALPAIGVQTAHSQEQQAQQQVEEVVVTGSRIARRDYTANSPIQTVDQSAFENQTSIGLESALNNLPQFVPAATSLTQFQDQAQFTDNNPTVTAGASTISLRGFAPNRNLVLLDGYRAVPVNGTMAVDINSIPAAAIQRVEVITGGASSVYGADAVAGVVNFILKKDFEGVALDLQTGAMQNGEAPETRASLLVGVNSGDGRGNIMVGIEAARRQAVHADDTDFYHHSLRDPTVEGTDRIPLAPYFNINTANAPKGAVIDGIFNQAQPGVVLRNPAGVVQGRVYWNDDGTVWTGGESFNATSPAGAGAAAGTYRYNGLYNTSRDNYLVPGDFPFRKIDAEGQLSESFMNFEANIPLDRTSVFGRAQYDLTDKVTVYAQLMGVTSNTRRYWTQSPAVGGWSMVAPYGTDMYAPSLNANGTTNADYLPGGQYGLNCEADGVPGCTQSEAWPVPPELAALLNSRPNPNEDWNFNYSLDFPNVQAPGSELRSIFSETRTTQASVGLRGNIDAIDGTWDVIVSQGKSKVDVHYKGHGSLERIRTVFTRSPNWGQGFIRQGNSGPPGNGFSGGFATCTSGMPVFRPHNEVTADCLRAIYVVLNNQSEMDQDYIEGNMQGHLVNMPAGDARFSAGVHSRKNSYNYFVDPQQAQESVLDNSLQFPVTGTEGSASVNELYGELLLPLLRSKPAVEHLDVELGYRYSDYEFQGGVDTYKALIDWGITEKVRFRGGRQVATRAPNIAEMFQSETQNFSAVGIGDPCGINSNAPFGANPAVNPNYQRVIDLCTARMGAVAASEWYSPGTTPPSPNSWNPFVNTKGNRYVDPETAETYTAGFVFVPRPNLNVTVDWYSIDLRDMIASDSATLVYQQCLSVETNPTGNPNNPACLRINRNPASGGASSVDVTYVNAAFAKTSGVDVSLDWRRDLLGGNFGVNFLVSSLLELKTQSRAGQSVVDWKGSLGPDSGTSLTNGAYDYRTFTTVNYGRADWNLSLRWRHLPSALDATQAVQPLSTQTGAEESYDVFDLSGTWAANDTVTIRFGLENLFDTPPVWTGGRTALDPSPSTGSGTTEAGFYDILGRQFYVGVHAAF